MRWIELVRCIFDSLMVIWFFRKLDSRRSFNSIQCVLCFFILLCAAPIYPTSSGGLLQTLFRFVLRAGVFALWLFVRKGTDFRQSLYYGVICWIAFTTENNIFLTPQLSFLRWNRINFSQIVLVNQIISLVIELIAEFLILSLFSRLFPWEDDAPIWHFRLGTAAIVVICQLYVKSSLKAISEAIPDRYISELTFFPILLQLALTAGLVVLERHLLARRKLEAARLDEVAARYRFETSQAKAKADTDIRQLHHDMKNHLLGIQRLTGDNAKLEKYVSDLLKASSDYEALVDTGNTMIDGLITEKMRRAEAESIAFSAAADLRGVNGISDMDLCTIFGNALDNAIEASLKVSDSSLRSIMLRCRNTAGSLLISVQNYYEGELKTRDGVIATSKIEPGHGMGLSGIKRTAEKYGGTFAASTDDYHNFILSVLIPLP